MNPKLVDKGTSLFRSDEVYNFSGRHHLRVAKSHSSMSTFAKTSRGIDTIPVKVRAALLLSHSQKGPLSSIGIHSVHSACSN